MGAFYTAYSNNACMHSFKALIRMGYVWDQVFGSVCHHFPVVQDSGSIVPPNWHISFWVTFPPGLSWHINCSYNVIRLAVLDAYSLMTELGTSTYPIFRTIKLPQMDFECWHTVNSNENIQCVQSNYVSAVFCGHNRKTPLPEVKER